MASTTTTQTGEVNPEQITQVSASGGPPKNRIGNAEQARAIYKKQMQEQFRLAKLRARIKNQLDGNPPFTESSRKKRGLDWLSNVNFRENWAACRKSINGSWNMFTQVFSFFDWSTSLVDPQAPHLNYGRIIGEEMTNILLDDPTFHFNFRLRLKQFYHYGSGTMFWPDEYQWRSKAILAANVIVPHNAKSCVGMNDFYIIRDEMELGELFDFIEDEEAATEAGWRISEVKKLIIKIYRKGNAMPGEDYLSSEWESIQQHIKNKTDVTDHQWHGLRVNHFLVQEKDSERRVTHIIMAQDDDEIGFLYYGDRQYESMEQVIHTMFYDEGDGYYRSVRGLAWELFATANINDRLTNALLDGTILSSGLIVQGQTPQDAEDLATITKMGPILQIAPGLQVLQQRSFAPPLQHIVEVRKVVQAIQANNSGTASTIDENFMRGMPEKSATQASLENQNEAKFETSTAAWSYVQWEPWLKETARRMLNRSYPRDVDGYAEHKLLMERCRQRGVPDQWLDFDVWDRKKAERAIGLGNPNEARRLTQSLMAMGSQIPEQGRLAAMQDWIGVRFGYHKVSRYIPSVDPLRVVTNEVAIIQLENNDLGQAQQLAASPDQPQVVHITWHMRWLSEFVKPFLENGANLPNLEQLAQATGIAIQHIQQHIELLSRDPMRKSAAKEWMGPLQQITQIYKAMVSAVQQVRDLQQQALAEAQRQQKAQDGIQQDREMMLKMEQIRAKERVDMANTASLDRQRDSKTLSAIENQNRKIEADIARADRESEAEIQRKNKETASKE